MKPKRHYLPLGITVALGAIGTVCGQDQTWNPAGPTNNWNTTDLNWDAGVAWTNGNNAIFGGTAETVDVDGNIVVGNITFNSSGYVIADADTNGTLTLSGSPSVLTVTTGGHLATISEILEGTGGVAKAGAGILTLSGANLYSGGTTITGILNAANNQALGTGTVTVNGATGNQLQLASGVNVSNPLVMNGGGVVAQGVLYVPTGNATYSGTIAINANPNSGGTFATGSQASRLTIAGDNTITSSLPVTVRNGWVVFSGAQNYTGGTSFNTNDSRSILQFAQTVSMPASGTVTVTQGNSIAVNAGGVGEFTAGSGTGAGTIGGLLAGTGGQGAGVTWNTGSSLGIDTSNASGTVTFNNAFTTSNNIGLIKLGTGTLELTNGGTYTGAGAAAFPFVARQGTLLLNGGAHTVNGEAVVGGTVGTAAGAAGFDATLRMDSGSLQVNGWLSVGRGNGTGGVSSNLVLNNTASATSVDFAAGFNAGSALNTPRGTITLNDSSLLSVNNSINIAESAGSNFTVNVNGTSTFRQTANAGETRVGGADGAVGVINVNGGTASFHRDLVLGQAGTASGSLVLNSGTVDAGTTVKRWLIINRNNASTGQITVNGGDLNLNTNTDLRFSTTNTAAGTSVVTLNAGAITSYSGNRTGNGSGVVDLMQSGTASANNTFNLNGGTLTVRQVVSATNNGTRTFNFNGGTLGANGDTTAFFNLGTGNARANVRNGGAIIDTSTFNVTITQALLHSDIGGDNPIDGGLTKSGTGTLTLTGVNTYNGLTRVMAGTLALGASGSIDDSSGVEISSGATFDVSAKGGYTVDTLEGVGTVVGALTVSTQLAIGNSPGTMTFNGDLTIGTGSPLASYEYEVVGGSSSADLGIVNGSLTLNGVTLDLVQLGAWTFGDTFTLFGVSGDINGTFDGLAEGSTFTAGGGAWTITYAGTTAGQNWTDDPTGYTFVNIMAVPEPGVAVLGALGALALLRRRRSA